MKSASFLSAIAFLAAAGASTAATPPNPKDLTQGSWELQIDKSKFACTQPPQKSHREIFEAGWGLISVHWTGADAKGKPMDIHYVFNYKGEKFPADIDAPANDAISYKLTSPNHVDFWHWDKNDKMTQELSRVVSDDGQTMTQTTKYIAWKGGKDCVETQVFARK